MTEPICPPDLSARPHELVVERTFPAPPPVLFHAWTAGFDRWFAEPGAMVLTPEVNAPYFFETFHDGRRHPHYGRFLGVERDRLLVLTWVNEAGTRGHETVLRVELWPDGDGSAQRLTHSGFPDDETRAGHESAWRDLLERRLLPVVAERIGNRFGG
ncbi:SRPBCC family protein [Phytohabitans houttuyneae]|uniref:Activator of Hsp90 ATPase homologue 1/2-like C-terminal domain-containing protein n=1 Tax=Phytohabitans houttuyneae TaxID=1076126 RepID=A0A6V8K379_9ACTN|nr:SRPBCC domain-containing protein [Phytohabitans houttuyneae]GFJ76811.1 hypothetical protein Phou_009910 [Phytohabitans houttuyneae]